MKRNPNVNARGLLPPLTVICCLALILASMARVKGEVEGSVIAWPNHWRIQEGLAQGKVLLTWEITNLDERYIRFRKRDLGFVRILDSKRNTIKPTRLGVDATRPFQESDYPLIGPKETVYLPFATTFKRNASGTCSLKVRSNSDGDEGWIYENLKEGDYSLVVIYNSMPNKQDKNILWDLEMEYAKAKHLNSFWIGEMTSNEVRFTIGGDS